jgi:hypothetical protein
MLRDVYDMFLGLGWRIVFHSMLVRPHRGPLEVLWHAISGYGPIDTGISYQYQ